ncbi:MAG: hypothetical protein U0L27_00460 [Ruminococcus sp.]|nr:hypothetical protein [Ruminococcus sp.]
MDFYKYIDEINLIKNQNNTERDLYYLVKQTLEPYCCGLSLRIVAERIKSELGQIFYGISSVPDIAILDRDFVNNQHYKITGKNRDKLKGCIEVKNLGEKLYTLEELKEEFENENVGTAAGQLAGEILWYKRLLYTNGTEWKLFTFNESEEFDDVIIEIVTKRIEEEKKGKFNWTKDTGIKKTAKKILNENIEEKIITKNCTKYWDEFIAEIKKILPLLNRDVAP